MRLRRRAQGQACAEAFQIRGSSTRKQKTPHVCHPHLGRADRTAKISVTTPFSLQVRVREQARKSPFQRSCCSPTARALPCHRDCPVATNHLGQHHKTIDSCTGSYRTASTRRPKDSALLPRLWLLLLNRRTFLRRFPPSGPTAWHLTWGQHLPKQVPSY